MVPWSRRLITGVTIAVLIIALATMGGYRLAGSSSSSQTHLRLAAGSYGVTWMSGTGSDSNSSSGCPRTLPCQYFPITAGATAPNGVLSAVDPGPFGVLIITQAITVDGGPGKALSATTGYGIQVGAGPNDVVILRHLQIHGLGAGGIAGIRFLNGKGLILDDVTIEGF